MLTITFKNVGHGDTIILEWQGRTGETEIGIIDCNQEKSNVNEAINHIKKNHYKKIRFMVLSHPHTDHFSGFPDLLDFCETNKIKIDLFWHTAIYDTCFMGELINKKSHNDLYASFVTRKSDRKMLKRLFRKIDKLHDSKILKEADIAINRKMLELNQKLRLEILSPSGYSELKTYFNRVFQLSPEDELLKKRNRNNPDANLLSSVIMIRSDNWHVLLTSDSTRFTFQRLYKSKCNQLNNRFVALQIPHHGSQCSHYENFWCEVPNKKEIPVFVSAGGNRYGLPRQEVIKFFHEQFHEIHATNFVGGLREYSDQQNISRPLNEQTPKEFIEDYFPICDSLSERTNDLISYGEKQIKIYENGSHEIRTN